MVWHGSVLVLLCASAVLATDPNQPASSTRDKWFDERMEFINRPAVSGARGILKFGGDLLDILRYGREEAKRSDVVKRAERVVRQWENGRLDPEPILLTAALATREFTKTSGELTVTVLDEDGDLLGLRIREKYRLPNGVESVFEEDYPVYVDLEGLVLGKRSFIVCYRTGLETKDASQWRRYVELVRNDADSSDPGGDRSYGSVVRLGQAHALTMPPVWISIPEPNRVEVSISVYDRAGHESESVPVDWLSEAEQDIPARKTLDFHQYERHRVEIAQWPEKAIDTRPDNAALLYY